MSEMQAQTIRYFGRNQHTDNEWIECLKAQELMIHCPTCLDIVAEKARQRNKPEQMIIDIGLMAEASESVIDGFFA